MPSSVGLGFRPPQNVEFFVCLSVCLFVCLSVQYAFGRQSLCADFAMKALEYKNDFDAIDRGRFVVVHLCSTFSDCCQLATPLNAEVENMAKIWVFRRQRATAYTD